jgi:2-polyprenyl-3-methyl-5-hydroxy-6-metoxy-1,4-benzoquinol methylase
MAINEIKATSFSYGNDYQSKQIEKYKNRNSNHWKYRIELFESLLKEFDTGQSGADTFVADIGTSIGTFAIEAAKKGYKAAGIDFDPEAIAAAKILAKEENVEVEFIYADVSQPIPLSSKIDIAVCFDIFEHMHDDELGSLLLALKQKLSENGKILFHTFPNEYDYIFFEHTLPAIPLMPLSFLPKKCFNRIVKLHATFIDGIFILLKGKTHKESIKKKSHCNPLSVERLNDIFVRAGYEIELLESKQLYTFKKTRMNLFRKQTITYRNIYGSIKPKR